MNASPIRSSRLRRPLVGRSAVTHVYLVQTDQPGLKADRLALMAGPPRVNGVSSLQMQRRVALWFLIQTNRLAHARSRVLAVSP